MGSGLVFFEDAEVKSSLKVCCRDIAKLIADNIVKVRVGKMRKKSTIDGGPSYYEIYNVLLLYAEDDGEITTCEFCDKSLNENTTFIRIDYMEKKDG